MADRRLSALGALVLVLGAAIALGGCDLMPQRSRHSAVTVRLPPPRAATPGFAFQDGAKAVPAELRETARKE